MTRESRKHIPHPCQVALLTSTILVLTANAQFIQQGSKLVGTGAAGNARQGLSVALSADGNTAIVGGDSDNGGIGAAWVYTRSGSAWTQQGSKLVGTGSAGPYLDISVGISADGNTAIIGGPGDNAGVGAALVYSRSGNAWTQQGSKLVGTGAVGTAQQGSSVALSADGNTAIVCGVGDTETGAAWVYTRSGGVWTQQGSKLVGTGISSPARYCRSVALSADGNTAIVGGSFDNEEHGAVWVYTRSAGVWTQQGDKLIGTGEVGSSNGGANQGFSVGLSADGNTAIVGGDDDNGGIGAVWVYTRSGGVWTQQGPKLVGTGGDFPSQGRSVALSADGSTAIVGGPQDFSSGFTGAVWVYTRSGGVWTQQGPKLVGTGGVGDTTQGTSVALSADGNTAIVGGPGANRGDSVGAAWIFVRSITQRAPSIASNGIVNGATFLPGVIPNSWITIQGTNLSSTTNTWDKSIVNGNLPTTLDGVTVSVGGKPAYIYYVSPGQINAVAPDVGTGSMVVTVTNTMGTSAPVSAVSQTVGPGFFLWIGKYAVATRQDFSWAVKNGTFPGVTTTPAKPGDVIIFWGTGFGPTSPSAPVGIQVPADKAYATSGRVSVTVGGMPAQVYGAALAPGFAGLYQVAIQIPPAAPDGDLPVVATVDGGAQSPASSLITVQH